MKLSVTTWSFPLCTLLESAAVARALGIGALDVGYFYRSSLDKARLLREPEEYAAKLVEGTGPLANLYHLFGNSLADRNLAGGAALEENLRDFGAALRFCRGAGIASIFVLPGVVNAGQSRTDALHASAKQLSRMQERAAEAGIILTIEPHVHSYLESPSIVLELLDRVPGLRLTLDYAHFHCLGFSQEQIDVLAPYAAHIHLRQAKMGSLQSRLEHGTLNFPAILSTLRQAGYSGFLSLEYVHQDYMDTLHVDVLSETIKLRDLVQEWLGNV
jgi:sugar phosphate isomerase/epimerase